MPCFRQSKIIVIPECNLGNEAPEIAEDLLATQHGVTILSGKENRYGVRTGTNSHAQYVAAVTKRFAEHAVAYHHTLVTANPFSSADTTPAERVASARKEFERQLRSFRKVMLLPKSILSSIRIAHSGRVGKDNERSGRLRDDMCMAFILGVFWSGHHIVGTVLEYGHGNRLVRPQVPGDGIAPPRRGAIGGPTAHAPVGKTLHAPIEAPGPAKKRQKK